MKIDKPGLYAIPEDEYHADALTPEPSLSSGLARTLLNRSPLHAWHESRRLNPAAEPKHSEAFDIGRAFHRLILRRGADVAVVKAGDWRKKAAKEAREEARAAGQTPMLAEHYEEAISMCEVAEARLADFGIHFQDVSRNELAGFAQIEGVWCRALFDHAPERGPVVDVKTCEDASPEAALRSVTAYGYDVQAAFYLDVWEAITGQRPAFRFAFVEKAPPHEVSVVELHDAPDDEADWMLDARSKCAEARRIWRQCLDRGEWPGLPTNIAVLGAPSWHRQKWADRFEQIKKPSQAAKDAAFAAQAPDRMKQ